MNGGSLKAIACEISRGGFSDERVFKILAGETRHSGVASRRHMWCSEGNPIEEGEPPLGETIRGFVAARVLKLLGNEVAIVSVPDGEVLKISVVDLVDRPSTAGKHVSVGS